MVDNWVVPLGGVVESLAVQLKDEYLLEKGWVGVFVDPGEGNDDIESLIVVVLNAVGEGIG